MLSLHELQTHFSKYIFEQKKSVITDYIRENGLTSKSRLQIYRNNIFITLISSLQNVYRTVYQLVGEEFFQIMAERYIKLNPPTSSLLHHFGANFSDFIENFTLAKSLTYLPEIAKLDWAYHEVFNEKNAPPFDLTALKAVPVDKYADMKFHLHPASRLFHFHFPVLKIQTICQETEYNTHTDISTGGDKVLVIRRHWDVNFEKLSDAEFILLDSFNKRKSFTQGCLETLAIEPDFNINGFLQNHIQHGTVVGFSSE